MKRSFGVALLLVALLVCGTPTTVWAKSATTDTASADYIYDCTSSVSGDGESLHCAPAPCSSLPHRGTASPSVKTRGTSTTSSVSFVATNNADDAIRLATSESWSNPNTLARHFRDHGADFAASSADDYARQASEFLQQPGTLTKIDADGVIRVYDPASNTFGSYNANGTTRTFFKPASPTYWDRQPGSPPAG